MCVALNYIQKPIPPNNVIQYMKTWKIVIGCFALLFMLGSFYIAIHEFNYETKMIQEQYQYGMFVSNVQHLPIPTFEEWQVMNK